ncbi:uncharacterized protein DUF4166 [Branchiibius hedensis]|uniref:DUF4166 domain-containing protein n=1 Tax=Branchiibius hedensis TaxID=672460 RepID=A0A2Y9C195_9MICO|nr:DUF4166 domain-containing protein [Branchiibius hedensis]PWJ25148.1 uncharacterized protein DUF4166 [Branchiibius hedensis]SSA33963.1 protein of unknown function [Branchiibius hedensis]
MGAVRPSHDLEHGGYPMTSIFARALGSDFDRLHPRMQERFGVAVAEGRACIGRGTMERIWRGTAVVAPFLRLGAQRNLLFPETGRDVPFTIENYPYVDGFGRETLTFVRTFEVRPGRRRRFDATMVYDPERRVVVDYLGTHQHVAADLDVSVDERGGLCIASDAMRLHEGPLSVAMPSWVRGRARVREHWDEQAACFRIRVEVHHGLVGPVFGYHGRFTAHFVDARDVPAAVRPYREEIRV